MRAVLAFLVVLAVAFGGTVVTAAADPRASPPPEKTPPPAIEFARPVVFVVALGSDLPTNARIAVALASELRRNPNRGVSKSAAGPANAFTLTDPTTAVVPEGAWGLTDYIEQCRMFPKTTQGAFIVLPPSTGSDRENYLVVLRENVSIAINAMIADCTVNPPGTAGTAKIVWASDTATGRYGRSTIQFLPFAVLTSVYLAFAPQRTFQTTSTTAYPTPNPLPARGARSSEQTLNSTVLNAGGTSSLQTNVVNAVAGAQLAFGRQGNPDHLTMHAAEDAVGRLLLLLGEECGRGAHPQATSAAPASGTAAEAPATDFCKW